MPDPDPQLVRTIADAVLAALAQRDAPASPPTASRAVPAPVRGCGCGCPCNGGTDQAEVRPPAGICTGDYSKFREMQSEPARPQPGPHPSGDINRTGAETAGLARPEPVLTGFVTADALQAAWDASPHATALLAPAARLTPLAQDLARGHADRIRRASPVASASHQAGPAANLPWLWWQDPDARLKDAALNGHGSRLRRLPADSLVEAVRDLAAAVRDGRAAGGVLLVRSAARAACYVNRCRSLRGVVATCGEAVEAGLDHLGCNTLIIETPHHGSASITAILDRVLTTKVSSPQHVLRDLQTLHDCP